MPDMLSPWPKYAMPVGDPPAVEWEASFEYTEGVDVCHILEDADGHFIMAAISSKHNGKQDIYVFKLCSKGELLWDTVYSEYVYNSILLFEQCSDGGYYIAGNKTSHQDEPAIFIIKIQPSGEKEWVKAVETTIEGWSKATSVDFTPYEFIFAAVDKIGLGFLLKTDKKGTIIGEEMFVNVNDNTDICFISKGGYILTDHPWHRKVFRIQKYNQMGELEWLQDQESKDSKKAGNSAVVETSENGFIAAGEKYTNHAQGIYLEKLDEHGHTKWDLLIGNMNSLISIAKTKKGGCIILGENIPDSSNPFLNVFSHYNSHIAEVDSSGNLLWELPLDNLNLHSSPKINAFTLTSDGGYILTGKGSNEKEYLLIKLSWNATNK